MLPEAESRETFIDLSDGCRVYCRVDDYTDPWRESPTLLCVHGLGESTEVWRGWVPYLAGDFRVVRIDVRGFGKSSAMPNDFGWSLDVIARDLLEVIAQCGGSPVYLLGSKSGGTMALKFAALHGELVRALAVAGAPVKGTQTAAWLEHIERHGVRSWAASSMKGRFGTMLAPEAIDWWIDLTARTPVTTLQGYLRWVPSVDIAEDVKRIKCPTLVIVPTAGKLRPVEETTAWQKTIANSTLVRVSCDGWHVAGACPDECARHVRDFFAQLN